MTNYIRALWHLYSLNRHASWSRDKLLNFQAKRLRALLHYAYTCVPYYHEQFRKLGIRPSDIRSARDLNRLPILKKSDIRISMKSMISKEYATEHLRMLSTSGSTGKPLFFYVSESELEFRKAKHLRANMSCGQEPFDNWITITSPHHFAESTWLQKTFGFYSPRPISVFDDISTQISLAEKMKPDVLDGYSSALFLLSKEIEKTGNRRISPRFILGGAELIDDYCRKFIEETLQAPFYDQYSSVEMERMAWQCPRRSGYHIDSDAMVMQFVDGEGEEVSAGERGEIVCTSLFNYAMPFIRYAIDDVGKASDEFCECGRPFPLMKVMEGRKDALVSLPDGRIVAPRTLTLAMSSFRFYSLIDQFKIVQKKSDCIEFIMKMRDSSFDPQIFENELVNHYANMLKLNLNEIKFEIKFVDHIPLDPNGKLASVVSNLTQFATIKG